MRTSAASVIVSTDRLSPDAGGDPVRGVVAPSQPVSPHLGLEQVTSSCDVVIMITSLQGHLRVAPLLRHFLHQGQIEKQISDIPIRAQH